MDIKNYIEKLRVLPENKKKAIVWTIVIILGLILGSFWIKTSIQRLDKLDKITDQFKLPEVNLPKIENQDIDPKIETFKTAGTYENKNQKYQIDYLAETAIKENSNDSKSSCLSLYYKKGYILIKSPNYFGLCVNTSAPADIKKINQEIIIDGKKYQATGFYANDKTGEGLQFSLFSGTIIDFGIYDNEKAIDNAEYQETKKAITDMLSSFKFTK